MVIGFGSFMVLFAGFWWVGTVTEHDYLQNTGQLVSERSCEKLERGQLRREFERIRERLKDFEDPPPKGFAGLQLAEDRASAR
jgi:hypothetical protein